MSNVNAAPTAPEIEYVVCKFEPTERFYTMVCKKPSPKGSWVFVTKHLQGSTFVPEVGKTYIVAIGGLTQSGKARRGQISLELGRVRRDLTEALKKAEWELDRHGRPQVVGKHIETWFGKFRPVYDNGYRSNGADVSPSIWFEPHAISPYYGNAFSECQGELFCLDEEEIKRAKAAKRPQGVEAPPDLGELLAAKMSQQGK